MLVEYCLKFNYKDLRLDKKLATYLFIFGLALVYITVYAVAAHSVARHAGEHDGKFYWRTTPAGSFFPWPREPGMFQALSEKAYAATLTG